MTTIKDIAKKMNLGVSTVSMALSGHPKIAMETRKKVEAVAKEMGYIKNGLAADLQRGRSNLILVVVEDASRPFFAKFISIVQKRVAELGFDLLISTTFQNHTSTAKRYISEHRAAGAIVYTRNIEDDFLNLYATEEFPIYVLGRKVENSQYVLSDFVDTGTSGYLNTIYLANLGFRKIAFVRTLLNTLGTVRKYRGYQAGLESARIGFDDQLVFDIRSSDFDSGYEITKEMIEKIKNKEIEAVYYSDDDIAVGGLHCLLDHGIKVPEDVSIVGEGNLPSSRMVIPQLTTTTSSDQEASYLYAVDKIVAILKHEDVSKVDQYYLERIQKAKEVIIERGTVLKNRKEV